MEDINLVEDSAGTFALPTGTISMSQVRSELHRGGAISLGDADVRHLAGKPSGTISMSDLHGKSLLTWVITTVNWGSSGLHGSEYNGYSTSNGHGSLITKPLWCPATTEFYIENYRRHHSYELQLTGKAGTQAQLNAMKSYHTLTFSGNGTPVSIGGLTVSDLGGLNFEISNYEAHVSPGSSVETQTAFHYLGNAKGKHITIILH